MPFFNKLSGSSRLNDKPIKLDTGAYISLYLFQ